jgi:hypothetical protein
MGKWGIGTHKRNKKIIKYGASAHNRSVYASPLKRLEVPFR